MMPVNSKGLLGWYITLQITMFPDFLHHLYSETKTVSGTEVPSSMPVRKSCSQPLTLVIRTVVSVRPK